jgi:tetratricopeptide (TPR) repeat protein
MRYGETPLRQEAAWLIPGQNAREWLDELVRWKIPLTEVTLYVVPRVPGETSPAGVLAISSKGCRPAVSRRCQPYARIDSGSPASAGGAIYLPVEARLDPEVTEAELAILLAPGDDVCLLHPAVGLIRFSPADARRVANLLLPWPQQDTTWDRAEPGTTLSSRLLSIEPTSVPSVMTILNEGRDDIATQRPLLGRLPRSPDEPLPDVLGRPLHAIGRPIARLIDWLTSLGSKPQGRKQPGQLGQWAQRQLARLDQAILASRHREIVRLMHLLKTDPENGLRYALPLQSGPHRGTATPGSRLTARIPDFSLWRLSRGGPADQWDLPPEFHSQLVVQYHGLAAREIRLGRHRRAAYIYAELLGNLELAANALKTGRHWREAAVLYREKLHRPDEAAACLEEGGLWAEAIALYEELGHFEKVGDLYTQLDQADNAQEAYHRAVARHRAQQDYVTAARILETKLADCDGAIACLEAGWPGSPQAGQCLEELFQLLGRHGRHQAACDKIEQFRRQPTPGRLVTLVDILSRAALKYPEPSVRATAADATRTIGARGISTASEETCRRLLGAVRRLVPADLLLGRDCDRFLQSRFQRPMPRPSVSNPPSKRPAAKPTLIRTIKLPGNVEWRSAVSAGDVFYAAGYEGNRLAVVQGFWEGSLYQLARDKWPSVPSQTPPILLACGSQSHHPVLVRPLGGPVLPWCRFPLTDELPVRIEVGTPPWLCDNALAVQRTVDGTAHVLAMHDAGLILFSYNLGNELLGLRSIPWSTVWPDGSVIGELPTNRPVPFHMRGNTAYLGVGNQLVVLRPPESTKVVDLPGAILGIHGSAPFSRARVAVALEQGAMLYWDESQEHVSPFAVDLVAPVLQFIDGGWLVAASEEQCHVYRTAENYTIRWEASVSHRHGPPIAVLSTARPHEFALVCQNGTVATYQTPLLPHLS